MVASIGIRREDKGPWERRVPITPQKVREIRDKHELEVYVQPSPVRVFREDEFARAGAVIQETLSPVPVIFGLKEIPPELLEEEKTYVFFAHVIKGQPYNMPMLKRLMELQCNLIDYEKVTDERGRRLIFFGWHAGVAGIIDTLWALGQRLDWEGLPTPFNTIRTTHTYDDLAEAKRAIRAAGAQIAADGLPRSLVPLIIGVAGYGNVGRGIQEILAELPSIEIQPAEITAVAQDPHAAADRVYRVTFREQDIVEPISPEERFDLQDYYSRPEKYRSTFEQYLPHLTVLANANYWDQRYPRLITKSQCRELFAGEQPPRLRLIGDVSCDIEGAVECTVQSTDPGNPVYVYNPTTGERIDGVAGNGVVIMAVDILPSELPREASGYFSDVLEPFIPAIAAADYTVPFEQLDLPPEIKRAVIVYRGELTPDYSYIAQYLD